MAAAVEKKTHILHGPSITPSVTFHAKKSLDELRNSNQQGEPLSDHDDSDFEELPLARLDSETHNHDLGDHLYDWHTPLQKDDLDQAPLAMPAIHKQKSRLRYREKRAAKRLEAQQAEGTTLKAVSLKKRSVSVSQTVSASCTYEEAFVPSKPAWMAQRDVEKDEREYSLQELVEVYGMTLIAWDGR